MAPRHSTAAHRKQPKARVSRHHSFPLIPLDEAISFTQFLTRNISRASHLTFADVERNFGLKVSDPGVVKLLDAASEYGLLAIDPAQRRILITERGRDIIEPTSPVERQSALLEAFLNVPAFRGVAERYAGQSLPEEEYFANTIVREFGVPRAEVKNFIARFTQDLEYLKAFVPSESGRPMLPPTLARSAPADAVTTSIDGEVREFLETCFVVMPFGEWSDRYYREIYVSACKDAGFEPLRADSLFTTGAVMEQIWAQIRRANVLLADLSGRNANVFYELGLAHALAKPVVFVAATIDDVPFDVRHLRVVVYDVREPDWADKLRRDIAAYLKNTRTEPAKSIPQPFRDELPASRIDSSPPAMKARKQREA